MTFLTRPFALAVLLVAATPSPGQIPLGPVTLGAGFRGSFTYADPALGGTSERFTVDSVRLYVNGSVTDNIKLMLNTEFDGATNTIHVLDAVGRFEFDPKFNVWAGRVLPPSDRANLAGPYYNSVWGVYTDGIQNGHPSVFAGRDNGVVYWGDFGKNVKISAGAFDGPTADGKPKVIGAVRVQLDFWDKEDGYYLNSTYYGDKNLLSLGGATQFQSGNTATTVDFLCEKKLTNQGVVTVEGEYSNYNGLGGYDAAFTQSQGGYGLAAYMFPKALGPAKLHGKIQVLGKYAKADFTQGTLPSYNQKTSEVNVNYIIKQFNARVMSFFRNTDYSRGKTNVWQLGVGLQLQI
jgi:hypothetical protein